MFARCWAARFFFATHTHSLKGRAATGSCRAAFSAMASGLCARAAQACSGPCNDESIGVRLRRPAVVSGGPTATTNELVCMLPIECNATPLVSGVIVNITPPVRNVSIDPAPPSGSVVRLPARPAATCFVFGCLYSAPPSLAGCLSCVGLTLHAKTNRYESNAVVRQWCPDIRRSVRSARHHKQNESCGFDRS